MAQAVARWRQRWGRRALAAGLGGLLGPACWAQGITAAGTEALTQLANLADQAEQDLARLFPGLRDWHFSGFATLGLSHSNRSDVGVLASFTQQKPLGGGWSPRMDSLLGLQADWQPRDGTEVQVQAVSRGDDALAPRLRIAQLRQDLGQGAALRVGRLRSPMFFQSDANEIGYANLAVRPPMPVYGIANSVAGLDGGELQWRHALGGTGLLVQAYAGQYDYTHRFYQLQPIESAQASLRNIRGLALTLNWPTLTLRASHTEVGAYRLRSASTAQLDAGLTQLAGGLQALAANPLLSAQQAQALTRQAQGVAALRQPYDGRPAYTSLGLDHHGGPWRLSGEWVRMNTRSDLDGRYTGQHLTLGYSLDTFTPYVGAARLKRYGPVLNTSALNATGLDSTLDAALAQTQAGLNLARQYADLASRSVTLGLRWDWRDKLDLKLQLDRLSPGSATSAGALLPATGQAGGQSVTLFTATLDWVF